METKTNGATDSGKAQPQVFISPGLLEELIKTGQIPAKLYEQQMLGQGLELPEWYYQLRKQLEVNAQKEAALRHQERHEPAYAFLDQATETPDYAQVQRERVVKFARVLLRVIESFGDDQTVEFIQAQIARDWCWHIARNIEFTDKGQAKAVADVDDARRRSLHGEIDDTRLIQRCDWLQRLQDQRDLQVAYQLACQHVYRQVTGRRYDPDGILPDPVDRSRRAETAAVARADVLLARARARSAAIAARSDLPKVERHMAPGRQPFQGTANPTPRPHGGARADFDNGRNDRVAHPPVSAEEREMAGDFMNDELPDWLNRSA